MASKPEPTFPEEGTSAASEGGQTLTTEKDLETGNSDAESPEIPRDDPDLVTWDGPQDPANPKNWTVRRKMTVTILVSLFTFISPVSSSMVSPALSKLGADLHMHKEIEVEMALSIFILGYALGPLLLGPLSEIAGRARVLQASNLFYLAWNLGCGFARNSPEFFIFRFLAGIGGSAPLAVGGGVIGDLWSAEQRGKAVGLYSLGPMLGPAVGPVCAGFIAQRSTWRWVFWSTSIVAGAVQVAGLLWMRETYAPVLLRRKRDRLVRETGNGALHTEASADLGLRRSPTVTGVLIAALIRPSRMLATQPIVQVVALYMAYLFGVMYLIMVTYPMVWTGVYGESVEIGGLNYLSLLIGSMVGMALCVVFGDRVYRRLKEGNGGVGKPEFRVPAMFVGSVLVPVGLFWYGWSVQGRVHWIMPNIGNVLIVSGTMMLLQSMQGYMIDTYNRYAASGLAAAVVLRSLSGFAFPLFAPYLYKRLDYGWGTSVLAFMSIAIGIPAPFIFYVFGSKLRSLSTYATQ